MADTIVVHNIAGPDNKFMLHTGKLETSKSKGKLTRLTFSIGKLDMASFSKVSQQNVFDMNDVVQNICYFSMNFKENL
ncbi:Hypothetical predicted protein [Octopus vulgaris]|uniref:Uncharacterized protein n=1 Tax=Octopus vulgaris TaxID=6645 RepID=A0AA36B227_OCTVU|nr:Hypothetical predicted protein [Octopus vulgaris]